MGKASKILVLLLMFLIPTKLLAQTPASHEVQLSTSPRVELNFLKMPELNTITISPLKLENMAINPGAGLLWTPILGRVPLPENRLPIEPRILPTTLEVFPTFSVSSQPTKGKSEFSLSTITLPSLTLNPRLELFPLNNRADFNTSPRSF